MANISTLINTINNARYGSQVRAAIASTLGLVNDDNNTIIAALSGISIEEMQAVQAAAETAAANAATSAANAGTSATNAANSATAASVSAASAATSATNAAGYLASVEADALAATNAASSAATSKTNAAISESNAANSAAAAALSESNIGDAETNCANSAAAALISENNAADSETAASGSAAAAALSETASGNSEIAAGAAAELAETNATEAETAAANAEAAKTLAESAASEAETAKTEAVTAAETATSKATEASNSATEAEASATNAANAAASVTALVNFDAEDIVSWNNKEDAANKGIAGGYAALDETGKVPLAQLPVMDGHTHTNKAILDKITTGEAASYNLDNFGDMKKTTYDANENGIVDNAEKVNGHTVESDVPASAAFTDTTYNAATQSSDGLLSAADKTKLDAITGTGTMTAAEILTELITVDGSGSELDADKLDGMDSTEFAPTNHGTHVTFGTGITALESGVAGITGIAETVSRSDHTHTLPAYPDLAGHAANTDIHVTADDQAEWNQNTTDIAALYGQTGTLGANDETARKEILEIKIKLDELNVAEFLNKTGIGFFDLFEDNSNIDTTNTTATVADTDVSFSGEQLLKFNDETFESFSDLELAIYDLERELFEVDVDVSASATISMNITPGSRTIGEKFWFNGQIYTITGVTES